MSDRPATCSPRTAWCPRWTACLYVMALVALVPACGGGSEEPAELTAEVALARDRAADHAVRASWGDARATLAPIVAAEGAAVEDLLRAANVELADSDLSTELRLAGARAFLERLADHRVDDAHERAVLAWCRYRVERMQYENRAALEHLDTILALFPEHVPTRLARGSVLQDLNRAEEAEREFRGLLAVPEEFTGGWRLAVLNRMRALLMTVGRIEEANRYVDELERRQSEGHESPGEPAHQVGTLGAVLPHDPTFFDQPLPPALDVAGALANITMRSGTAHAVVLRLGRGELLEDLGLERKQSKEELFGWRAGAVSVAAFGAEGLEILTRDGSGAWTSTLTIEGPVRDAVAFDRMNIGARRSDDADQREGDHDLDLLVVTENGALRLLENVGGEWTLHADALARLADAGPGRLVPVDYDHDGDVDLVATLPGGVRLLRNDGFDSVRGAFTDVTGELTLPRTDVRVIPEDVDGDNDVDLLVIERAGGQVRVWDNRRGGVLVEDPGRLPDVQGDHIVAADLDGNGRMDLAAFGDVLRLFLRTETGAWRAPLERPLAARPTGAPLAVDWDLDGAIDLVWPVAGRAAAGLLAPGFGAGGGALTLGDAFATPATGTATITAVDLDGDQAHDLVRLDERGVHELLVAGGGRGSLLDLAGLKDNARGIGAIVETRAGLRYRRVYWRGAPLLFGHGDDAIDLVRITWPNGVQQTHHRFEAGAGYQIWQTQGLVGSCPFLYAWNGTTYEFISDVLGITPLGLPMEPGLLVPPDHDEYVLVRGDQLVPKDGFLELQFTEELREVTYLDRIRLDVVDHPADVEVFPNERFSFPPFPEAHIHTVREPLLPLTVVDGQGRDWTRELAANDGELAAPFEPHLGQFQGLATPHVLELTFDAEAFERAPRLRLVMNGWFFWTDASVNMAAARHPDQAFVPPLLSVPDGAGGWRDAGPPLGFPAGKLKTMVVDVTPFVNRDDPRLRIFSTLRLYWDSIRLAIDADDAATRVTSIEPASAVVWERGFSAPIPLHGEYHLEWFEWERLAEHPRWNQHPGFYTRLGESVALLGAVDDRFVVMGAGDALTVKFAATGVPPLPEGWTRDYLVFLDGWAKDRDPNTLAALFVEPLPFHGMSGYPYGPDEAFPDTEAHRAWRRDWLTRPARRWIESLVPPLPLPLREPLAAHPVPAAYHEPQPQAQETSGQ